MTVTDNSHGIFSWTDLEISNGDAFNVSYQKQSHLVCDIMLYPGVPHFLANVVGTSRICVALF